MYVLHTRPYSNTSLIVEFFSQKQGRIAAVARSARGPQSRYKGQLQLFTPILASWSGNHELKTLNQIELAGLPLQLDQKPLFCGFYLNELLMRLLHKEDPHPNLFDAYSESLSSLVNEENISRVLRLFEKKLLEELGYALPLAQEAKTRLPIQAEKHYRYESGHGFLQADSEDESVFLGADLLCIAQNRLDNHLVLQVSKRLMRMALAPLLGGRPLNSRALF